jgi:hypothetical protein
MSKDRNTTVERIVWHGITIEILFEPNWLGSADGTYPVAHLEVNSIDPERAPLPITETGYRSHFTDREIIAEAGGPVAFVEAWLAHEAKSPKWQRQRDQARQLKLF